MTMAELLLDKARELPFADDLTHACERAEDGEMLQWIEKMVSVSADIELVGYGLEIYHSFQDARYDEDGE
jgi:hypothetical protein